MKPSIQSNIGTICFYGCDIVEIVSITVNGFVNVKSINPKDKYKNFTVHIENLEFI